MRLVLIDTFALIHRAYHALPKLTTPQGEPIGAVYGFTTLFLKMLKDLEPDYVAAAFDLPEETFRRKAYAEYQAHRPEMPQDLAGQIEKIKDLLLACGLPLFSQPGYEADDLIGTLVEKFRDRADLEIIILTGDLDTLQLVSPKVKVYTLKRGLTETVLYDEDAVRERFGFQPKFLPDFKGLKGDPSDNIPGVAGIGDKTAGALVSKFGTLEDIYRALENPEKFAKEKIISPRQIEALEKYRAQAFFSRDLATIRRDVPADVSSEHIRRGGVYVDRVQALFEKWGFKTLVERLGEFERQLSAPVAGKKQFIFPEIVALEDGRGWLELEDRLKGAKSVCIAAFPQESGIWDKPQGFGLLVDDGPAFLWSRQFPLDKKNCELMAKVDAAYVADGKPLIHQLRNLGITPKPFALDCKIAGWLLSPDSKKYGLGDLSHLYLRAEPDFPADAGELPEAKIPAARDIVKSLVLIRELSGILESKLREEDLGSVWQDIEKPLTPVLAEMEMAGIYADPSELRLVSAELHTKLADLERRIYSTAGERFNLASPRQLSKVLFENLKISTDGIRRTPGGIFSTDSEELGKISSSHAVIPLVLSWREMSKILSTYVDALPGFINSATGRIHTSFLQTGTATGRLASENPNMQNIPKRGELAVRVRRAFRAEGGWLLASFDYSQIELRIAAYLSHDEKMTQAFRDDADVHALTASHVWNVPPGEVTPEMRSQAKALNFGVLYGMGWKSFSQVSGVSPQEARDFRAEYFRDFPGIARYIDEAKESARTYGYARTLSGRKRFLPELFSPDRGASSQAERVSVNMPIQGFAADLIKLAMIRVSKKLKEERLEGSARLLLQVHDELLFEVRSEIMEETLPLIRREMEKAVDLDPVPLRVEIAVGNNWGEMRTTPL